MALSPRIVAAITTVALSACSGHAELLGPHERAYLAGKKEVVFVCQPRHAPFEFVHQGQPGGMNVELAQWMAADMGFKIRFESAPLDEALEMVRAGRADALTSLFYSPEREADFDFSRTVKLAPVTLFVRNDRTDIAGIEDLEGLKVAIMGSSRALESLQERGIHCQIRFVPTTEECAELVATGAVDAMIGNELVTQHYLYAQQKPVLKEVGEPLFTARLCMAVAKGNHSLLAILDKGIDQAQKSGTLYTIQGKWLGSDYEHGSVPLRTILVATSVSAASVAVLISLILLWNRKLQRTVAERTRQYAESEERLRQLFENSPDAVFVLDRQGRVLSANARACSLVKMGKHELLAKTVYDLAPKVFADEVADNMAQWFRGELRQCEGAAMATDGSICPIEMTGRLQRMDGQEVLQLHVRDITLRKEAEEKIHAARQMAEEAKEMAEQARKIAENASQAKSEFLANMSHEIRTPLNGIVGMSQLLVDTGLDEDQKECIDTIQQSSSGLLRIINHVLDISKIEAGQMDVREAVFDPRSLCESLVQQFEPQARQAGIEFICTCQENVPHYLVGDEGLIGQVLVNLLGNALKFTHRGSVALNVECHKKSREGAELYFQVIDTGIGIPPEKQALVFEKFSQADGSTKRLYGGTGLGLAICKQLVELMGGHIGLISSVGQGSTFYFNLLLAQASRPVEPLLPAEGEVARTVHRHGVRVLLAEDNRVNQNVAIAILQKAGCTVDAVDNGQDAIQQIRRAEYDIVLMDCQMPVMDGYEATARIRAMREPVRSIPIIAITAHAMKDDRQRCIDAGMNDYIAKPVGRQALIDLINKHTA